MERNDGVQEADLRYNTVLWYTFPITTVTSAGGIREKVCFNNVLPVYALYNHSDDGKVLGERRTW